MGQAGGIEGSGEKPYAETGEVDHATFTRGAGGEIGAGAHDTLLGIEADFSAIRAAGDVAETGGVFDGLS